MSREEQVRYLRELRPYFITSLFLIGSGMLLGLLSLFYIPGITQQVRESVSQFLKMFIGLPKFYLALAIFFNNSLKTLLVIVLGMLFGVLPVFFLLLNGWVIAIVFYLSAQSRGLGISLLAILPHGAFELPAVLLGTSIGLRLGVHAIRRFLGRSETTIRQELGLALRCFLTIIVPLLIVAAFIEAFITSAVVAG